MRLAELTHPAAEGVDAPPLIVAHGLFGSARNWRALIKRLGAGRAVIAVDMRNHGDSPQAARHDYPAMAADLAVTIEAHGGRAALLGHSMGGKAAMALAQARPELIERLIVADIAPVAYGHSLLHHVKAMAAVDLSAATRRGDVEAALASAIPEPEVRAFLALSADLAASPPAWRLNLSALGRNMELITGYPAVEGVYPGPALFLAGGASDYLTEAHWPGIEARFPNARLEVIEGAGHWLHVEKPRPFIDAVAGFLRQDGSAAG